MGSAFKKLKRHTKKERKQANRKKRKKYKQKDIKTMFTVKKVTEDVTNLKEILRVSK